MRPTRVIAAIAAVALAACGFSGIGGGASSDAGPSTDGSVEGSTPIDSSTPDSSVDAPVDAPSDSNDGGLAAVYGHTTTELYRMDPTTKAFALVGPLAGCAGMSDIAVDKDGNIFGVGTDLYTIDSSTGACTKIANGPQPFTLTFVPAGTVDVGVEALVAFSNSSYVRVNPTTGAVTTIAPAVIAPYSPSGDIVFYDGKAYVSVDGPSCDDCLLEVSPVDGHIVKNLGDIGRTDVYGLGAWGGKLYGFLGDGDTCEITITGSSVSSTIVPNAIKPASWIGGGSTTRAPK